MEIINIRESLLKIDRETDCEYDLTTLYESCNLSEEKKKELVKMIANYDSPEALGSYMSKVSGCGLAESIGDDDLTDEELDALKDSVELEEGAFGDLMKVAKAAGKSLKNDTPIGRAVTNIARGIKKDAKTLYQKSGLKNVVQATKDAAKDTDIYKNYKADEGAAKVAQSIKQHKKDMKSPDNISKYLVRLKKKYPMFDYTSSRSKIAQEIQALCKEKGWDFNQVIKKAGLKLKESLNEAIDQKALEAEIRTEVANIIDDVDMPVVEFSTEDGFIKIEVRAELGYDMLMDVANQLDPIVSKYDDRAYFEPVTAGILVAYVDENGYVNELDQDAADMWIDKFANCKNMTEIRIVHSAFSDADLSMATVDAVWDKLHDIIDKIRENEKDEYLFDDLDTTLEELFEQALAESAVPLNEANEFIPIEIVPDNRKIQYYIGDKEVPYTSWEEAKEHFKDDFNILDYKKELQDYINAHDGHFTVEETTDDRLCIDILWGDWKHDHAFADYLVKEFFSDKGLYPSIEVETVEEDGSDAYSAIHYYDLDDFGLSGIYVDESLNESKSLYLFPELNDEDLEAAKTYGLNYLGRNKGAKGDEDNYVVSGDKSSLQRYADKYLGYELHPDYLYDDADDFAGEIIKEEVELTNCPNCGGERFNDNTGLCVDCGYDEKGHGELDEDKSINEDTFGYKSGNRYYGGLPNDEDIFGNISLAPKVTTPTVDTSNNDKKAIYILKGDKENPLYKIILDDVRPDNQYDGDESYVSYANGEVYWVFDMMLDNDCPTKEEALSNVKSYLSKNNISFDQNSIGVDEDDDGEDVYVFVSIPVGSLSMKSNESRSINESDIKHIYYRNDIGALQRGQWLDVKEEDGKLFGKWNFEGDDSWYEITDVKEMPYHYLNGARPSKTFTKGGWRYWLDDEVENFWDNEGKSIIGDFEIPGMPHVKRTKVDESKSLKERNLTRAERHNRNMDRIFDYKKSTDSKMMQFLRDNSDLSEEEIQKAYDDDKLGLKIKELGLHDAFWGMNEGYELLNGTKVEVYSDYYVAKDRAKSLGLIEAEYGDTYSGDYAYSYWNESGDRNDDEQVIAYYRFKNGTPRPLTVEEREDVLNKYELGSFDNKAMEESVDLKESDEEEPYSKEMVEQDLKSITHNFTDKEGDLKCGFEVEKDYGVEILKKHYEIVEVSGDDRRDGKWYHISFSNPKNKKTNEAMCDYAGTHSGVTMYSCDGKYTASVKDGKLGSKSLSANSIDELKAMIDANERDYRNHLQNIGD